MADNTSARSQGADEKETAPAGQSAPPPSNAATVPGGFPGGPPPTSEFAPPGGGLPRGDEDPALRASIRAAQMPRVPESRAPSAAEAQEIYDAAQEPDDMASREDQNSTVPYGAYIRAARRGQGPLCNAYGDPIQRR